jgi:hypothetical protein
MHGQIFMGNDSGMLLDCNGVVAFQQRANFLEIENQEDVACGLEVPDDTSRAFQINKCHGDITQFTPSPVLLQVLTMTLSCALLAVVMPCKEAGHLVGSSLCLANCPGPGS